MKVLERLTKILTPRSAFDWQPITLDSEGFRVGETFTTWTEVTEIAAFKHDALTVDEVWFQVATPAGCVRICEEQPGFPEFEARVIALFPTAEEWRQQVILPPFARNFTVLYKRT